MLAAACLIAKPFFSEYLLQSHVGKLDCSNTRTEGSGADPLSAGQLPCRAVLTMARWSRNRTRILEHSRTNSARSGRIRPMVCSMDRLRTLRCVPRGPLQGIDSAPTI